VGSERLIRGFLTSFVLIALASCGRAPAPEAPPPSPGPPHLQIVRMKPTSERARLFERFRAANGEAWVLDPPGDVGRATDPIRGFVRRARRQDAEGPPVDLDTRGAAALGEQFVVANAGFLGFTPNEAAALTFGALPSSDGRFAVHAEGRLPMKGYESFTTLEGEVDLGLVVGRDGVVRAFVNASRLHPRLAIGTRPRLAPDDPRLVAGILGRPVFALVLDPTRPRAPVRELRRVPLGRVEGIEIRPPRLTVHVSHGPARAWATYRLAYVVVVDKDSPSDRQPLSFRWTVDADTGDVVEDAKPPLLGPMP
jgi:hypothetical protein